MTELPKRPWLIYGAYGYSGKLIARAARDLGMRPLLAGRNAAKLSALGEALGLDTISLDLADSERLRKTVSGVDLVLHCAGPFSSTSAAMLSACLGGHSHYLDITGEIDVFRAAHARSHEAQRAGVVVCPGVGFDVIPTDCIAASLHQALPGATQLALGFDSRSILSPGTAKTAVEGLGNGGAIRRGGQLEPVPLAWQTRRIDFGDGEKLAMTIPWGDVATAYYTTGIPDIEVYVPASPRLVRRLRRLDRVRGMLRFGPVQNLLKRQAVKKMRGPDPKTLEQDHTYVWGEARDAAGHSVTARVVTANGYKVTAHGAVAVARRVLLRPAESGYRTPSQLMGPDFVASLPGSGPVQLN